MANLGQITQELQDYINSPVQTPRLGEFNSQPTASQDVSEKPRLAKNTNKIEVPLAR